MPLNARRSTHCIDAFQGGVPWHLDVTDTVRNTNILYIAGKRDRTVTVDTTRMAKDREE